MPFNTLIAILVGIAMISFFSLVALGYQKPIRRGWIFPAVVSALFFTFSLYAIVFEGPFGFWTEHVRNYWGNQIWIDLLIAASIGWYLIVPEARALKMNVLLWLILIVSSGCIGFTAMLARLLYLREQSQARMA